MDFKKFIATDKISLSISKKIFLSFSLLIAVTVIIGIITIYRLFDSSDKLNVISEQVNPTLSNLDEFKTLVKDAKTYATNWVYVSRYEKDKEKLKAIHEKKFPQIRDSLMAIGDSLNASVEKYANIQSLVLSFESVLNDQQTIMTSLNNGLAYEDAMTLFICEDLIESSIIPTSDEIIIKLDAEIEKKNILSEELKEGLVGSFDTVWKTVLFLTLIAVAIAVLISIFLSSSITAPINVIREKIAEISIGKIPEKLETRAKDEIGQMSNGINTLINAFSASSQFASDIEKGNLDSIFKALSDDDVLGHSLLSMRNNMKGVIDETNEVVRMASDEGNLDARINIENKEGAWKGLSITINEMLESIAVPILEVNDIVTAMADGDLSKKYDGSAKGQIGELVNNLNIATNNLSQLLTQIARSADSVDDSSVAMLNASEEMNSTTSEIASAISQMSSGAQNQVNKVEESSSLVEKILKSSADMGDKAKNIQNAAQVGVENSEKGKQMVDNLAVSMEEISDYTDKTTESIKVLALRSAEITRVLSVITEIASQTNLLALNAAIEAAQAGDAGRGFAVVAEEIRKLAEDSKHSAQEIEKLVDSVKSDTDQATQMMQSMNKSVQDGDNASKSASATFNEIALSNKTTLELSEGIVSATQSQTSDMNQVVSITESVVVIAEQTAAGTEEIASSASELSAGMENYNQKSEQLTGIAASLRTEVQNFKL
ncbi:methyl-accepting chemotaxis protein [Reichenbachiella versicolor]|uniref:methyl-accepting chemotaxis protein n=1 Tax=Reichenbachiella versicolor TaxID=1821036 RepID=UPI0013A54633|nr:methyl-accepting chemotaxis protein [Reichenbachiella versicolor]